MTTGMDTAAGMVKQVQRTVTRGVKLLLIALLALGMSLLALFVDSITTDRSSNMQTVRRELSAEAGGPQVFLGPTLLVPYTQTNVSDSKQAASRGMLAFAAASGKAEVRVEAEERSRSLYRLPVFTSDVLLRSEFATADLKPVLPAGMALDWSGARLVVGVSNPGSALSDAVLQTDEGSAPLLPVTDPERIRRDGQGENPAVTLLGVGASQLKKHGAFAVTVKLRMRGAQRVSVLPYAQSTRIAMHGNWASPGFDGAVMPVQRSVAKSGFDGEWYVPATARGLPAVSDPAKLSGLFDLAPTTTLVEVADAYQSVERALKYAPLFLGLVFLSYFLFEVTSGKPMHVAQYALVGVAQLIFYLLLLSFAERIGFDWGFLLGSGATVALLSLNAGWVFRSARQRWRALGIFGALYAMIYGLLRMEDNALLLGALGSFGAVAAAMYVTRGLDWYGGGEAGGMAADKSAVAAGVR